MNRLGIELLSVFGMNPVEHVVLAADLGCGHISTGLTPFPVNPQGYAPWSLRDDPALRREMIAVMRDRDVAVSLGEGFAVRPNVDVRDRGQDLDIMAELGAGCLGGVAMDPDPARVTDQFGALVEMAATRGLQVTIEFSPGLAVTTLDQALALVGRVDRPNFGVTFELVPNLLAGRAAGGLLGGLTGSSGTGPYGQRR